VTFFSGGLLQDWQDITWITDDDEFTHDFDRREDAARLLRLWRAINQRSHKAEAIFQAVSLTPNRDMFFEDLCSIPDLVAGATAEFYTYINRTTPLKPDVVPAEITVPNEVSDKAKTIMEWYVKHSLRLKRLVCLITPSPTPEYAYQVLVPTFPPDPVIGAYAPGR
jgi:hypothetical protein